MEMCEEKIRYYGTISRTTFDLQRKRENSGPIPGLHWYTLALRIR
jgi:hypothetical protein